MIVGGVGEGNGVFVGGRSVGVNEAVSVAGGVRDGPGVSVGMGVLDDVAVGGKSGVGVRSASAG